MAGLRTQKRRVAWVAQAQRSSSVPRYLVWGQGAVEGWKSKSQKSGCSAGTATTEYTGGTWCDGARRLYRA